MITQLIEQTDTLTAAKDTLTSAASSNNLSNLSFDINNISVDSLILTALGYTIVFLALLFLFVTFMNIARFLKYRTTKKLKAEGKITEETEEEDSISGEVTAAISMALTLHFREVHDFENTVITIKKVQKPYSPWSSKIYGLRQYPQKR